MEREVYNLLIQCHDAYILHVYALTCIVTELLMEHILCNMFLYSAVHEPYVSESVSLNLLKDILVSTNIKASSTNSHCIFVTFALVSVYFDVYDFHLTLFPVKRFYVVNRD
jgi:hypothetical protein